MSVIDFLRFFQTVRMAVYSSILAGVRRSPSPGTSPAESKAEANGASVEESEELSEKEEKEVEEVVEDILAIRAPAMLKRNLTNLARENIILKRKVEALKEAVAAGSKTGGSRLKSKLSGSLCKRTALV